MTIVALSKFEFETQISLCVTLGCCCHIMAVVAFHHSLSSCCLSITHWIVVAFLKITHWAIVASHHSSGSCCLAGSRAGTAGRSIGESSRPLQLRLPRPSVTNTYRYTGVYIKEQSISTQPESHTASLDPVLQISKYHTLPSCPTILNLKHSYFL